MASTIRCLVVPVGYTPTAVGYPPTAVGCPPTAVRYTPTAVVCPPAAVGYTPTAVGCPPTHSFFFSLGHPLVFVYLSNTATFLRYIVPFSIDMSDDGNSPPRRKVRGKGKGGAGAKYCTMGPGKRKEQFPSAHGIGHPVGLGRLPTAANVFIRAVKLSIEGRIVGCFNGVWGGGSIGALLLLAEGVTPLLLNHSRRVGFPTTLCILSRGRSLHVDGVMVSADQHAS